MLTRRAFLSGTAAAAALASFPGIVHGAVNSDRRLVVIVLRGGLDGLGMVPPLSDPRLRTWRPNLSQAIEARAGIVPLTADFGLDNRADNIGRLFAKGEVGFAHAVATPYRERSHFDAQDVLENGTATNAGARDGWLNRVVGALAPARPDYALSAGWSQSYLMKGPAPTIGWAPDSRLPLASNTQTVLQTLYAKDPLFAQAFQGAVAMRGEGMAGMGQPRVRPGDTSSIGAMVGQALSAPQGTRIAGFAVGGWDTHIGQVNLLGTALGRLDATLMSLYDGLGAAWNNTAVLAVTEFGRTVRENGTHGTDHGTASVMMFGGGLMRGGQVIGDWPGLAEKDLHQNRDLRPTSDVRRYAAWTLKGLYGLSDAVLTSRIFPGLEMGRDPGILKL
ncbi:MAG: DUF1501 domain-containing protein [Magnetospiraceae bacterium]